MRNAAGYSDLESE